MIGDGGDGGEKKRGVESASSVIHVYVYSNIYSNVSRIPATRCPPRTDHFFFHFSARPCRFFLDFILFYFSYVYLMCPMSSAHYINKTREKKTRVACGGELGGGGAAVRPERLNNSIELSFFPTTSPPLGKLTRRSRARSLACRTGRVVVAGWRGSEGEMYYASRDVRVHYGART